MLTKHAVLLVGGFELAVSRPSRPVNLFPGHYLAFFGACPLFMPLHGNVLFENENCRAI